MFYGYLTNSTVAANGTFNFTQKYLTNSNLSYDSGVITVREPGWYKVHFDMSGSANNSNIIPTLVINDVASPYAKVQMGSAATDNYVAGSFDTIVRIVPAIGKYTTMKVVNTGAETTIIASNFTIERIA